MYGVLWFQSLNHGTLTNSEIYNNITEGYSTIHAYYSDFSMDRVLIHSNTNHTGGGGGAIDVKGTNSPLVEINRCTIINNHGRLGGGVRAEDYSDILINSSIIRNNTCLTNNNYSAQIDITSSSADIAVKFSNIQNSDNKHSSKISLQPTIIETTGFDKNVTFDFADTEIIGRFTPNSGVELNKKIDVYFDLSQISIFDKQTELRL